MSVSNGNHAAITGPPKTAGYRAPSMYTGGLQWDRGHFHRRFVPDMLRDPQTQAILRTLITPVLAAKIEVEAARPDVARFVARQFRTLWDVHLPRALYHLFAWGSCGGEATQQEEGGTLGVGQVVNVHMHDRRPWLVHGEVKGVNVYRVPGVQGAVELRRPGNWYWVHNEGEDVWGWPRLAGAWKSWNRRTQHKGYDDLERLYWFRMATRAKQMRCPPGTTLVGGRNVPNFDYADELLTKLEVGAHIVLDSSTDPETGKPLWELIEDADMGDSSGLDAWGERLKWEGFLGCGIFPEVIQAQETGLGQSGRGYPFTIFLTSADQVVGTVARGLDGCVVRPLVRDNYGAGAKYEIKPKSLLSEEDKEDEPKGKSQGAVDAEPPKPDAGAMPVQPPGQRQAPPAQLSADAPADDKGMADWWADLFQGFTAAGEDVPPELLDAATEDLEGGQWVIALDGDAGRWEVHHASDVEEDPVQLAAERAPRGGVVIKGKRYAGGQWVPASVVASASPAEKAALEGTAKAKGDARRARGSVDAAALAGKLAPHAHQESLDRRRLGNVRRAVAQLHRHHGELTLHRIEELHDALQKQLARYAGNPTMEAHLRGKLGDLHHMLGLARERGVTGQVAAPTPPPVAPKKATAKKPAKSRKDSLISEIVRRGGVNRASMGRDWNISEDFAQSGLLGILKPGGISLDEMAENLKAEGVLVIPSGRNADDYLMEQLKGRAHTLHHDYTQELQAAEAAHYEELANARAAGVSEDDIAEATRGGEAEGRSAGQTGALDEGPGGLADEEGAGGVGDFEFGANAPPEPPPPAKKPRAKKAAPPAPPPAPAGPPAPAAQAQLQSAFDAARAKMTPRELDVLSMYTESSRLINDPLLSGAKLTPKQEERAAVLDSALAKTPPLADPVMVYRGFRATPGEPSGMYLEKVKAALASGGTVSSPAYTSTTLDPDMAHKFSTSDPAATPAVFEIAATHGLYTDNHGSNAGLNKEFVLPRGAKLRVTGSRQITVRDRTGKAHTVTAYQMEQAPRQSDFTAPPDLAASVSRHVAAQHAADRHLPLSLQDLHQKVAADHPGTTPAQLHDALRQLHAAGQIELQPVTRAAERQAMGEHVISGEVKDRYGDAVDTYGYVRPGRGVVIGKGSTGDVRQVGGEVRKQATRDEGKIYQALAGVEGVAPGREEDGEIVTPHYPNVVSRDTVPAKERHNYAPVVKKSLPQLVNAVTALSEAGYNYNDPIQVGFDKGKQGHLFDFSAATKDPNATRENLSHLANYLDEFGLNRHGKAVRQIGQVMDYIDPDARELDSGSPEAKDGERIADQLDGKPAKYAYYTFNARTIPGVAQTEHRDGAKAVFSDKPLSADMMQQWELNPAIHRGA